MRYDADEQGINVKIPEQQIMTKEEFQEALKTVKKVDKLSVKEVRRLITEYLNLYYNNIKISGLNNEFFNGYDKLTEQISKMVKREIRMLEIKIEDPINYEKNKEYIGLVTEFNKELLEARKRKLDEELAKYDQEYIRRQEQENNIAKQNEMILEFFDKAKFKHNIKSKKAFTSYIG